jgi:hypothetical protein
MLIGNRYAEFTGCEVKVFHPLAPMENASETSYDEIAELILSGGAIDISKETLLERLHTSHLIGCVVDTKGKIICTTTIKNPVETWVEKCFYRVGRKDLIEKFNFELGYVATAKKSRGCGYWQLLLKKIIPIVKDLPIFATTTNPRVSWVLGKFGFYPPANSDKSDKHILVTNKNYDDESTSN